jgi:ribokinase
MGRVIVTGSLNMDLIVQSPRIPAVGETILGHGFSTAPGGKGANQAVAAARLGAQVAMIGRLGDDSFAGELRSSLADSGVDLAYIRQDTEKPTGVALITVDDAGQNSIVVASGANFAVTPQDIEAAEEAFTGAQVLLLQLEIPLAAVQRAAELAHTHGVQVVLNPAPAQPLPEDLLVLVDYLVPNETEAALLTGLPVRDLAEARIAGKKLRETGFGTVLLTLGEKGTLLVDGDGSQHFEAFPVRAVDTTAAGDAFLGGFAAALSEGRPLAEAVRWGNAAGGLATTKMGAQPSLPWRESVEALLSGK